MPNLNSFFNNTGTAAEKADSDNIGAFIRAANGELITSTLTGSTQALDVSVASINIDTLPPATVSTALRIDSSFSDINFSSSSSYQTLYTYSGSGILYGFLVKADTDKLQVRLTVDGIVMFDDMTVKQLEDLFEESERLPFLGRFLQTGQGKYFNFSPPQGVPYATSVVVSVKKDNNGSFEVKDYLMILSKET